MVGRLASWNEGLAYQLPTLTNHLRSSKVDLFSLVIIRSIGWDRRRRKGWYRMRDFVSRRFFCMKKIIFYMLSFPIDTFVKWVPSFLVWKENIRILCSNLLILLHGRLLVCSQRIVSFLGKFTEIGNTCLIAEFRTLDCLVGLHWIQSCLFFVWLHLILCQFVQKACVDELEKEIRISKRRRYRFQLYQSLAHLASCCNVWSGRK